MKKLIEQLFKFGIVGVICFLIDYLLMIGLTEVGGLNYLVSSGISFSVSVIVNYILSIKFVFSVGNKRTILEFVLFIVFSVIGLLLTEILMWSFVDKIGIHYMISKIVVTLIVMIYNFVTRKLFLEKKER